MAPKKVVVTGERKVKIAHDLCNNCRWKLNIEIDTDTREHKKEGSLYQLDHIFVLVKLLAYSDKLR